MIRALLARSQLLRHILGVCPLFLAQDFLFIISQLYALHFRQTSPVEGHCPAPDPFGNIASTYNLVGIGCMSQTFRAIPQVGKQLLIGQILMLRTPLGIPLQPGRFLFLRFQGPCSNRLTAGFLLCRIGPLKRSGLVPELPVINLGMLQFDPIPGLRQLSCRQSVFPGPEALSNQVSAEHFHLTRGTVFRDSPPFPSKRPDCSFLLTKAFKVSSVRSQTRCSPNSG